MNRVIFAIIFVYFASPSFAQTQPCETVGECAQLSLKAAQEALDALALATPTGAVVAFDLDDCPVGWSIYEEAKGRFIRGLDPTGENDTPDRGRGSIQNDALQGHWHQFEQDGAPGLHDGGQTGGGVSKKSCRQCLYK